MFKLLGSIPRKVTVACSGGIDSMVVLDFLRRNHEVTVAYFNHGTAHGADAESFLMHYCKNNNLQFVVGRLTSSKPKEQSQEEFWRNERYKFLNQFECVVTGHHLDDVLETWIWSSLNGNPRVIPYRRNNVIRPFLMTSKKEIRDWAARKKIVHVNDPSNEDTGYMRNFIRKEMVDKALVVNPGIHTMLRKKIQVLYENNVLTYTMDSV